MKTEYTTGKDIRSKQVTLIVDGEKPSTVNTSLALELADEVGLTLVQVGFNKENNVPVCKILDLGRLKYEKSIADRAQAKKAREQRVDTKEVQIRAATDTADLDRKAKKITEIVENGDKVLLKMRFFGREMAFKDAGIQAMREFVTRFPDYNIDEIKETGRNIITTIQK